MIEFVSLQSSDMSNVGDMSVQEKYASSSICFGCGPANLKGLRIRSFRSEDGLIMEFDTLPEHQAFPGMVNGGIIGTLLDCHGNWAAAIAIMDRDGLDEPPCTVTASYTVYLRRTTPSDSKLVIRARAVDKSKWDDRIKIEMTLEADGILCAEGKGLFVAVKEGHPAFHRWS